MPKKFRFRKMFFICSDKKVIEPMYEMCNAYQRKDYADNVKKANHRDAPYLWEEGKHIPIKTVEGFYLVHESLFDEILKKYIEET